MQRQLHQGEVVTDRGDGRRRRWRRGAALVWRWVLGLDPARVELACVLVADVWLMLLLAWAVEPAWRRNPALEALGLGWSLGVGAAMAVGLAVCGAGLSDAFGASTSEPAFGGRRRRIRPPQRSAAVARAMLGLVTAAAAAVALGPVASLLALVCAAGLVFYTLLGRFFPAASILGLGLLHALLMLVPNPQVGFAWPIVLALTHVTAAAVLAHVKGDRRPALATLDGWLICGGWTFLTLLLVVLMSARGAGGATVPGPGVAEGDLRWVWVGPAGAAGMFLLVTLRRWTNPSEPERFLRLANLWLIVYGAGWLLSAGQTGPGLALLGLLAVAVVAGQGIEHAQWMWAAGGVGYRVPEDGLAGPGARRRGAGS